MAPIRNYHLKRADASRNYLSRVATISQWRPMTANWASIYRHPTVVVGLGAFKEIRHLQAKILDSIAKKLEKFNSRLVAPMLITEMRLG